MRRVSDQQVCSVTFGQSDTIARLLPHYVDIELAARRNSNGEREALRLADMMEVH